jgi:hypothetical protein
MMSSWNQKTGKYQQGPDGTGAVMAGNDSEDDTKVSLKGAEEHRWTGIPCP